MNDLFWLDTGTGRPLVLLHGGFLDHRMWHGQVQAFARQYRVIAPDARGHGLSANATEPFRPPDDLAALLRHLNTGPAVLVGVSMGASVAADTAIEHPDLVSAVVVSGAGTGTGAPYFTDPWTTGVWAEWNEAMAAGDLAASVETFMRFVPGPHRSLDDVDPRVVYRLRQMTTATMSKHTADEPNVLIPLEDAWARASTIEVPLVAIHGALDSPDHIGMAERLVQTVTNGHAVSIDDTAHYPNMERPDLFNAVLADFLNTL